MESPFANKLPFNQYLLSFFLYQFISLCLVIFFLQSYNLPVSNITSRLYSSHYTDPQAIPQADPCTGRYIYMYDLPEKFNVDILRDCKHFNPWHDLCSIVTNSGLGPRFYIPGGMFQDSAWYNTDQFTVSVIFHNRMKQYDCLTTNYNISDAVYVPYYAGFDVSRYLWDSDMSKRNFLSIELVNFLKKRPEWMARRGRDHFVVVGRTMWDFQHDLYTTWDWGNNFSLLPEVQNMTIITVESRNYNWNRSEFSIPYPSYFHPSKKSEVVSWQEKLRSVKRPWLFSFVGGPRPEIPEMVRNYLIHQCANSTNCKLQQCGDDAATNCNSPTFVMRTFQSSIFCLEPPGDSVTRRSVFDSMLAGCIPVLFHPATAYLQYSWHLPKNASTYSVFIPEEEVINGKVNVEDVLLGYGDEQIKEMREEVIRLIPTLTYNDPRYKSEVLRDAFDVAVEGVTRLMRENRKMNFDCGNSKSSVV